MKADKPRSNSRMTANIEINPMAGSRPRCQYYMEQKRRQCNMTRNPAEKYCAEHLVRFVDGNEKTTRIRVVCPLDPSHSVWKDQIDRHIKKCRATKALEKPTDIWYAENINIESIENAKIPQSKHSHEIDYEKWIPVIEEVYSGLETLLPERKVEKDEALERRLGQLENQKHAIQQASLIAHMKHYDLLDPKVIVAEFGCGRGELSRYIAQAMSLQGSDGNGSKGQKHWLIDRAGPRMKLDGKIVKDQDEAKLPGPKATVVRTKIDIKDLKLGPEVYSTLGFDDTDSMSVVSKHLCGAATDLTLASLRQLGSGIDKVRGIAIALCCRQLCSYHTYPKEGREWLGKKGIDREGFESISKMTSWAVCGIRPDMSREDVQDKSGLNFDQRERVGQMARRIIDYGRIVALKNQGFEDVRLVEYVDPTISLENVCLLARGRL